MKKNLGKRNIATLMKNSLSKLIIFIFAYSSFDELKAEEDDEFDKSQSDEDYSNYKAS